MRKLKYEWKIRGSGKEKVKRYCHNCGTVSEFTDSGKRRRNASGKDIREYAIFKCANDHTWNRFVDSYKSSFAHSPETTGDGDVGTSETKPFDAVLAAERGYDAIEIFIAEMCVKTRLDKLLSANCPGLSRRLLAGLIDDGTILVDGRRVRPGHFLKAGSVIAVSLAGFRENGYARRMNTHPFSSPLSRLDNPEPAEPLAGYRPACHGVGPKRRFD